MPLAPAVTGLGWRLLPWVAFLIALWLLPVLPGNLASGLNLAPQPDDLGITWSGILLAALAGVAVWRFITRPRSAAVRPCAGPTEPADWPRPARSGLRGARCWWRSTRSR